MLTSKSHVAPSRTYLNAFLQLCSAERFAMRYAFRARKAYARLLKYGRITALVHSEDMRIVLRAPEEFQNDVEAIKSFKEKRKSELMANEDFMKLAEKAETAINHVQLCCEAIEKAASYAKRHYKEVVAEKARKARLARMQDIYDAKLANKTPSDPCRGVGKRVWNGKGVKIVKGVKIGDHK